MELSISTSLQRGLLPITPEGLPSSPEFLSLSEVPAQHPAVAALDNHSLDTVISKVSSNLVHCVIFQRYY